MTFTNVSLLEVLILGVPILLVVNEEPSIQFGVRSFFITVLCFFILLPIFLPNFCGDKTIKNFTYEKPGNTLPFHAVQSIALAGIHDVSSRVGIVCSRGSKSHKIRRGTNKDDGTTSSKLLAIN